MRSPADVVARARGDGAAVRYVVADVAFAVGFGGGFTGCVGGRCGVTGCVARCFTGGDGDEGGDGEGDVEEEKEGEEETHYVVIRCDLFA